MIWAAENVIAMPGSSLLRAGDAWHVFVVENGRAVERTVQIGARNQDQAEIVAGLKRGEQVIRYPGNELEAGRRAEPSGSRTGS